MELTIQSPGRTSCPAENAAAGVEIREPAPTPGWTDAERDRIEKQGGTSYTFVTGGIAAAVDQARATADGKNVLLAGGVSIVQQALAAGLVDEVSLHVAPVLIGHGIPLFGASQADLHCAEATHGENAVHLRYEVKR